MTQTKALAPKERAELAGRIDEIAAGAADLFRSTPSFAQELALAQAITDMRGALTPEIMAPVMALMNTDLGFRCDRPNGKNNTPYSMEVVRDVFIEARVRGFRAVGNEFNIISGRFYAAKNGLRRLVTTFPGLTFFKDSYGAPTIHPSGKGSAIVKCSASWKFGGKDEALEADIPVKYDEYSTPDQILGKAERKLLARVYNRLTGMNVPEGDAEEGALDVTSTPAGANGLKDDLRAKAEAARQ